MILLKWNTGKLTVENVRWIQSDKKKFKQLVLVNMLGLPISAIRKFERDSW
jgi:hypothetical protein